MLEHTPSPRPVSMILSAGRGLAFLVAISAVAIAPAAAADLEPYLFAGVAEGDLSFSTGILCVQIVGQDCPVSATAEGDSEVLGLGVAFRLDGPWWLDLRASQADTEVRFRDNDGREIAFQATDLDLTQLHAGVLYRFSEGTWSPFVTAFGGTTRLDSSTSTSRRTRLDVDRISAGVGAGLLLDFGERTGLRFDLRAIWTDLPEEFDGDFEQTEASVGFRLRL